MKVFVGFDDTDVAGADRGTGKFARWFGQKLPEGVTLNGVVRQQLPMLDGIPYTSHNSAACLMLDSVEQSQVQEIIDRAADHIREHFIDGSDPGLCVVTDDGSSFESLLEFGRSASTRIVTQKEALKAVNGFHLSGHGGTEDGIIGAVAGVGLTLSGWSGRFIDLNGLREFGTHVRVGDLEAKGIRVLCTDRNAMVPAMDDMVDTQNWLRPRLWAGGPVLPVEALEFGLWRALGGKNKIG